VEALLGFQARKHKLNFLKERPCHCIGTSKHARAIGKLLGVVEKVRVLPQPTPAWEAPAQEEKGDDRYDGYNHQRGEAGSRQESKYDDSGDRYEQHSQRGGRAGHSALTYSGGSSAGIAGGGRGGIYDKPPSGRDSTGRSSMGSRPQQQLQYRNSNLSAFSDSTDSREQHK
jgi:hypothetical protein